MYYICILCICNFNITDEDLSQEEHLDDEFLWNLKLLSEVSEKL